MKLVYEDKWDRSEFSRSRKDETKTVLLEGKKSVPDWLAHMNMKFISQLPVYFPMYIWTLNTIHKGLVWLAELLVSSLLCPQELRKRLIQPESQDRWSVFTALLSPLIWCDIYNVWGVQEYTNGLDKHVNWIFKLVT